MMNEEATTLQLLIFDRMTKQEKKALELLQDNGQLSTAAMEKVNGKVR